MRIVAQNGIQSFNFDNIEVFVNGSVIVANTLDRNVILGEYESGNRAEEVFEEIHKCYTGMPIVLNNVECDDKSMKKLQDWKKETILCVTDSKSKVEYIDNAVFQMPEE